MDIRKAKRGSGTVPPKVQTPEREMPAAPSVDGSGDAVAPSRDFGNDAVIAQYMAFLEENGITEEDLQNVLSAIITSGNVSWKFMLFDSIEAEFQIRPAWVNDCILELVDEETKSSEKVSVIRYNNIISVCNLAASLTRYKGESYNIRSREDFDNARKRIQGMPYVLQNALVNKLAVFDRSIAVATSDWAVKNFTKARKEK